MAFFSSRIISHSVIALIARTDALIGSLRKNLRK